MNRPIFSLDFVRNNESFVDMGIHYKPSQWRGKRLVYRSIDPEEPKQDAIKVVKFLIFIVIILLAWLLWRWVVR